MGPFLRAFADELIKVADWSSVVRPPTTATGTERTPAPGNALGPSNAMLSAIPKQRMESPGGPTQQTWRPSPSYRPSSAGDPVAPAPTPKPGGAARAPSTAQPAWESSQQMHGRQNNEAAFNAGRSGAPLPASLQNAPGLGSSPRPLSNEEKSFVAGTGAPGFKPMQPGGLQMKPPAPTSPLQAGGFRPPKP